MHEWEFFIIMFVTVYMAATKLEEYNLWLQKQFSLCDLSNHSLHLWQTHLVGCNYLFSCWSTCTDHQLWCWRLTPHLPSSLTTSGQPPFRGTAFVTSVINHRPTALRRPFIAGAGGGATPGTNPLRITKTGTNPLAYLFPRNKSADRNKSAVTPVHFCHVIDGKVSRVFRNRR